MKKLFTALCLILSALIPQLSYANPVEGKDYTRLASIQPTTPGKIEVIEFFWYGCSHCYTIEPSIEAWTKTLPADVSFRREHVIWPGRPDLAQYAKLYHTLSAMGIIDSYQLRAFKAIQQDRIDLRQENTLFEWVKKSGIDLIKFQNIYHSFAIQTQVTRTEDLTRRYAINAVPIFIVNGQYQTSPAMVGSEDGALTKVLTALINKARRQK